MIRTAEKTKCEKRERDGGNVKGWGERGGRKVKEKERRSRKAGRKTLDKRDEGKGKLIMRGNTTDGNILCKTF